MSEIRLGDIIDDYCTRCRLLTNHSVVAMLDASVRKVRCRTCQHEHEYRQGKGGVKKIRLSAYEQVLASINAQFSLGVPPDEKPKRARRSRS